MGCALRSMLTGAVARAASEGRGSSTRRDAASRRGESRRVISSGGAAPPLPPGRILSPRALALCPSSAARPRRRPAPEAPRDTATFAILRPPNYHFPPESFRVPVPLAAGARVPVLPLCNAIDSEAANNAARLRPPLHHHQTWTRRHPYRVMPSIAPLQSPSTSAMNPFKATLTASGASSCGQCPASMDTLVVSGLVGVGQVVGQGWRSGMAPVRANDPPPSPPSPSNFEFCPQRQDESKGPSRPRLVTTEFCSRSIWAGGRR